MATQPPNHLLETGCYYVRYRPQVEVSDVLFYEGTLRIADEARPKDVVEPGSPPHTEPLNRIAAVDLYKRLKEFPLGRRCGRSQCYWKKVAEEAGVAEKKCPEHYPLLGSEKESSGIPIFPRQDYVIFLESISIANGYPPDVFPESDEKKECGYITIRFEVHRFNHDSARWSHPGRRIVVLKQQNTEDDKRYPYHGPKPIWAGPVMSEEGGNVIGQMELFGIKCKDTGSDSAPSVLRKATVKRYVFAKNIELPDTDEIKEVFLSAAKGDGPSWDLKLDDSAATIEGLREGIKDLEGGDANKLKEAFAEAADPSKEWTLGELHDLLTLINLNDKPKPERISDPCMPPLDLLDSEWVYRLLFVNNIEDYDRGVMFEVYGTDADNMPREGAAIEANWTFPDEEVWGIERGKALQKSKAYLRVTVHELAHAMGLPHHHEGPYLMNTTDVLAEDALLEYWQAAERKSSYEGLRARATSIAVGTRMNAGEGLLAPAELPQLDAAANRFATEHFKRILDKTDDALRDLPFPKNVKPEFHAQEVNRLRFWPDPVVRPGAFCEGQYPVFGDSGYETPEGIALELVPLLDNVPLGAPVRFHVRLRNHSDRTRPVPAGLGLSSGHVSGEVTDPSGRTRSYRTVKKALDSHLVRGLPPKRTLLESLTLSRGALGALFPMPGLHAVRVRVRWSFQGKDYGLDTETRVLVTPPADDAHRAIAYHILATPEVHLAIDVVGDHLETGNAAVRGGIANPILSSHYRAIEARRLVTQHFGRKPDYKTANKELVAPVVLGAGEIKQIRQRTAHVNDVFAEGILKEMHNQAQGLLNRGQIDAWEHHHITNNTTTWRAGGAIGAASLIGLEDFRWRLNPQL